MIPAYNLWYLSCHLVFRVTKIPIYKANRTENPVFSILKFQFKIAWSITAKEVHEECLISGLKQMKKVLLWQKCW